MNNLSTLKEISQYRLRKPEANLIIDTNIFLLFLVGVYDSAYLKDCPLMTDNGRGYQKVHFDLLEKIIQRFVNPAIITPHVLAEINMLSRKRVKPESKMKALFTTIIQQLDKCIEHHIDLKVILKSGGVLQFGFADISLIEAAFKNKWVILTDEFELYSTYREKTPIIYFNNIVASEIYKASL